MTALVDIVSASTRVGETASRLAKVREIARLLGELSGDEIAIGVSYLAGELPQRRIGVGYAALAAAAAAAGPPAEQARLSIVQADRQLTAVAELRGNGSAARRGAALSHLFSQATPSERAFLFRLLTGELRQGALAGVMIDAIAAAARVAVARSGARPCTPAVLASSPASP